MRCQACALQVPYTAGIILSRDALRDLKAPTDQDDEILIKLPKTVQSPAAVPLAAATVATATAAASAVATATTCACADHIAVAR